jgi:hypothetical protein
MCCLDIRWVRYINFSGRGRPEAPIGISDVGTSTKMSYQFIPVGQGFFVNGYDGGAGLTYNF